MPDNDSGNGNGGEGAAITYQEARQALGPPRDRLDLVALFAADQADALRRAIEAQADSMQGLFALVQQRFALIEAEIERMKAERERDRPTWAALTTEGGCSEAQAQSHHTDAAAGRAAPDRRFFS